MGEIWKAPIEHSALGAITLEAGKMDKCKDLRGDDKGKYLMSEQSEQSSLKHCWLAQFKKGLKGDRFYSNLISVLL